MQRRATTLIGVLVMGLAFWLAAHNFHASKTAGRSSAAGAATDDGGGLMYAYADAGPTADFGRAASWREFEGGVGTTMPDGAAVPPLPFVIPKQIRFGIVLVSYAGVQPNPAGGPAVTRSKAEARLLADKLLATAQQDFHAAVQQGDSGSADDIGLVKVGIVEPAPEYVLFTLPVDGVGGPVDTPRGYWIVKRIE
jgi:hypothetical protein